MVNLKVTTFEKSILQKNLPKPWLGMIKKFTFDPIVGLCWILDHLIGNIFPFEMIVYGPKSKLKRMKHHKNTETLIKSSLYFS